MANLKDCDMPASKQRRIVITGVSRGLGLAMAEGFIGRGHTIWGCARDTKTIGQLRLRWKNPHAFEVVDVCQDDQVLVWARQAEAAGFVPDLLINNAALVNHNSPLWKISAAEFDQVMAVNVSGVANVLRHFVPLMLPEAEGVIVNFSSGWGRSTSPEVSPYCATKWAIEGLSRALAEELPRGMAAVPLNPGIINTDMLRSCFGADAASYPAPQEWARRAAPFLLSLGAKDNGQSLTVPG